MTRIVRGMAGILGAATLTVLTACASEPAPEPFESASEALVAFDVEAEVVAAEDRGGCSIGEIRGCVCNSYGCYRSCFCG